jgi:putative transcriptional regulator
MDVMDAKLFGELLESVAQMGEIDRGERAPSREFVVDDVDVKMIRRADCRRPVSPRWWPCR